MTTIIINPCFLKQSRSPFFTCSYSEEWSEVCKTKYSESVYEKITFDSDYQSHSNELNNNLTSITLKKI